MWTHISSPFFLSALGAVFCQFYFSLLLGFTCRWSLRVDIPRPLLRLFSPTFFLDVIADVDACTVHCAYEYRLVRVMVVLLICGDLWPGLYYVVFIFLSCFFSVSTSLWEKEMHVCGFVCFHSYCSCVIKTLCYTYICVCVCMCVCGTYRVTSKSQLTWRYLLFIASIINVSTSSHLFFFSIASATGKPECWCNLFCVCFFLLWICTAHLTTERPAYNTAKPHSHTEQERTTLREKRNSTNVHS